MAQNCLRKQEHAMSDQVGTGSTVTILPKIEDLWSIHFYSMFMEYFYEFNLSIPVCVIPL